MRPGGELKWVGQVMRAGGDKDVVEVGECVTPV